MGVATRLRSDGHATADPFPRPTLMKNTHGRTKVLPYVLMVAALGVWQAATQADFLKGDVDQLSIDEHGRVTLGPELTRVHDAAAPFVWTIIAGADGAWFLGTGNDGKVIRVDRSGQASTFYDSAEMEVHALAAAPN